MESHTRKLLKRIKLKDLMRKKAKIKGKNLDFFKLMQFENDIGEFAIDKNRVSSLALDTFGIVNYLDLKRVVDKDRPVSNGDKTEVLLFEDGSWDFSMTWTGARPPPGKWTTNCVFVVTGKGGARENKRRLASERPKV